MPLPVSPKDAETSGMFSCFLCDAEGFTATGMQQHIILFHRDDSGQTEAPRHSCAFCQYSTSCEKDFSSHLDIEHSKLSVPDTSNPECENDGEQNRSGEMKDSSSFVDNHDCLETSLRLNDCPVGDDFTDEYGHFEDLSDDLCGEVDVDVKVSLDGESDGNMDIDGKPASLEGGTTSEESNLSVILGSIQNGGYIQPPSSDKSIVTKSVVATHQGGARPKQKHSTSPGSQVVDLTDLSSDSPLVDRVVATHQGGARPKQKHSTSPGSQVVDLTDLSSESPLEDLTDSQPQASGNTMDSKHKTDADRVLNCPFCSFHTLMQEEIHMHVNQQHMMEDDAGENPHPTVQFQYSCPFCSMCFDTPRDLSEHITILHPDGEVGGGTSSQEWPPGWSPVTEPHAHRSKSQRQKDTVADSLQCPVCGVILKDGNEVLLSLHVSEHFAASAAPQTSSDNDLQMALELQSEEQKRQQQENKKFENIQTQYGMDHSMTATQQFDKDLEQAAMAGKITTQEFNEKKIVQAQSARSGVDDGSTQLPGILERLQDFYSSRGCPRTVARVHLSSSTDHYGGSYGDRGWGCGYRNLQMMLSCLVNDSTYLQVLFNGVAKIPSVQKLQQLIEAAWQKGFDRQGCQQLGSHLVNTRKWIGATEIVALLSSFRVKCQLLDFVKPSGPDNTHPKMLQWVREYFASSNGFKPPLYLQHQGHSRTIVGVEELNNGSTNLLLFDPGVPKNRMVQFHGNIHYNLLQTVRKTINAFRAKQYQIVAIVGILEKHELEEQDDTFKENELMGHVSLHGGIQRLIMSMPEAIINH